MALSIDIITGHDFSNKVHHEHLPKKTKVMLLAEVRTHRFRDNALDKAAKYYRALCTEDRQNSPST